MKGEQLCSFSSVGIREILVVEFCKGIHVQIYLHIYLGRGKETTTPRGDPWGIKSRNGGKLRNEKVLKEEIGSVGSYPGRYSHPQKRKATEVDRAPPSRHQKPTGAEPEAEPCLHWLIDWLV